VARAKYANCQAIHRLGRRKPQTWFDDVGVSIASDARKIQRSSIRAIHGKARRWKVLSARAWNQDDAGGLGTTNARDQRADIYNVSINQRKTYMNEKPVDAVDTSAPLHRVVMPSLYELREHARTMLEVTNEIELARAIRNGDRIDSYQSYVEWLRAGRNGTLHVHQAIDTLLFDLFDNKDKAALAAVVRKATQFLLDT
jgi:hypothetical protein